MSLPTDQKPKSLDVTYFYTRAPEQWLAMAKVVNDPDRHRTNRDHRLYITDAIRLQSLVSGFTRTTAWRWLLKLEFGNFEKCLSKAR